MIPNNPSLDITDAVLTEHAYLIQRGVRALALVGHCPADEFTMLRMVTRLESVDAPGAIPFVLDRGDGFADCGYAASPWVLDLYRWVATTDENAVPDVHRHRVLGLLLGYSSSAIESFEDRLAGRMFGGTPITSEQRAAT